MDEAGFGEVSQEGKGALPNFRHRILEGQSRVSMVGLPFPQPAGVPTNPSAQGS